MTVPPHFPGGAEGIRTSDLRVLAAARLTVGAARCGSAGPSAEDAPLDLALDRRRFTCPAQQQRLEGRFHVSK